MIDPCSCGSGNGNSGVPSCVEVPTVGARDIIVQTYAADGTKNRFDVSVPITQATWEALFNEADETKRYFPLPKLKNSSDLRGDAVKQTFNDDSSIFIREAQRVIQYLLPKQWGKYLKNIQTYNCGVQSVFRVDKGGKLIGKKVVEGGVTYLEPVPIESSTFYPKQVQATDTEVAMIEVNYEIDSLFNDADSCYITAAEMDNYNLLSANGLLDLNVVSSAPLTTGVTVDVSLQDFGSAITPTPVKGLTVGDFTATEKTPAEAAIPLTSSTEISDGKYVLVYTAPQTSADTQIVTASKDGFAITDSDTYTTP